MTKCVFQNKKNLFMSKNIDITVRKNLLKVYVWNVALCGSKTWTIGKPEEKNTFLFEKIEFTGRCSKLAG